MWKMIWKLTDPDRQLVFEIAANRCGVQEDIVQHLVDAAADVVFPLAQAVRRQLTADESLADAIRKQEATEQLPQGIRIHELPDGEQVVIEAVGPNIRVETKNGPATIVVPTELRASNIYVRVRVAPQQPIEATARRLAPREATED